MNTPFPSNEAAPSPGQVVPRRWPRWAMLLMALAAAIVLARSWAGVEEHWSYLSRGGPATMLAFDTLSPQWTEKRLRQHYAGLPLLCNRYQGEVKADRYCGLKVSSHNGVHAMFLVYFLRQDRLQAASIAVPWWRHDEVHDHLMRTQGAPRESQALPSAFVRLHGWAMPEGAGLYFNRERSLLSLNWSSIYWSSAEQCPGGRCFSTPQP